MRKDILVAVEKYLARRKFAGRESRRFRAREWHIKSPEVKERVVP